MERLTVRNAVLRVWSDFVVMPDLQLTVNEGRRLWNLDEDICEAVFDVLVELRFLEKNHRGAYQRHIAKLPREGQKDVA